MGSSYSFHPTSLTRRWISVSRLWPRSQQAHTSPRVMEETRNNKQRASAKLGRAAGSPKGALPKELGASVPSSQRAEIFRRISSPGTVSPRSASSIDAISSASSFGPSRNVSSFSGAKIVTVVPSVRFSPDTSILPSTTFPLVTRMALRYYMDPGLQSRAHPHVARPHELLYGIVRTSPIKEE